MPDNVNLDWIKVIGLLAPLGKFIYSKARVYLSKEKNNEVKVNLVQLQAPPVALLEIARVEDLRKETAGIKRWRNFGYFYLLMFCLQMIPTYSSPNIQEVVFAVGFFWMALSFARLASAHWKRKEHLITLPLSPIGLSERHLVREMILQEEINFLVARAITCLRKLGAKLYQVTPADSDSFEITAIMFQEGAWFKYSSYFDPPTEIGVFIAQKAERGCSVKLELSLGKSPDKNMKSANEFIRMFLTEDRIQQITEADRPMLTSHQS